MCFVPQETGYTVLIFLLVLYVGLKMIESTTPDKIEVVQYLLETEGRVMLCVDATQPGVNVPRRFNRDDELRLILSNKMPTPLKVGPRTIEALLGFGGVGHMCVIPLHALWGAYNPETGHSMFWPDSMPERIRRRYHMASDAAEDLQAQEQKLSLGGDEDTKDHGLEFNDEDDSDDSSEVVAPVVVKGFQPKVVIGGGNKEGKNNFTRPQLRVIK